MPAKGWRSPKKAERDTQILELCRQGLLYTDIAERFGIAGSTVSQIARSAGLALRTTADRVVSEQTRQKQSEAMKGRERSLEYRANISKAKRGVRNGQWRGDDASYGSTHTWLRTHFGTPKHCEHCGGKNAKCSTGHGYNWAYLGLRGGKYSRRREDYMRLCRSCHSRHDRYGMEVQCNFPLDEPTA